MCIFLGFDGFEIIHELASRFEIKTIFLEVSENLRTWFEDFDSKLRKYFALSTTADDKNVPVVCFCMRIFFVRDLNIRYVFEYNSKLKNKKI